MSHCVDGQEEAIVATCVSGGDAHNSSGYTESSTKRKRLGALVAVSHLLIIPIHYCAHCWRSLLPWLDFRVALMSSVGLWWVCVLIQKQINQNKVRLTATLSQSQHPESCQQRFTSMPVESHEVAFFTKMSHKLQRATFLAMCANILPCGSVFFWRWFLMKGAVCLGACGPKARVHRAGSLSNIQHVSYRFSS